MVIVARFPLCCFHVFHVFLLGINGWLPINFDFEFPPGMPGQPSSARRRPFIHGGCGLLLLEPGL